MRIAIVGAGVSGLTCAFLLSDVHEVTLFEADDRLGGHAHTVEVCEGSQTIPVDTGFLVYNDETYPNFIKLLERLEVTTKESVMSFSYADEAANLEWKGSSLNSVFAQRRNLLRPRFLRMVLDIVSFNRTLRRALRGELDPHMTLGDLLATNRWGRGFQEWYLVPMGAAIWSANPQTFTDIPARTFAEFFSRHGLLRVRGMPTWRTITGGSREYVQRIADHVRARGVVHVATPVRSVRRFADHVDVTVDGGVDTFDHVILACHSDQALALLIDPSDAEVQVLGAIRYQENEVTLHTDTSILPASRRAWAAWNYRRVDDGSLATLTYNISTLQSIEGPHEYLVSLNSNELIDPNRVIMKLQYAHPVLDQVTVAAQQLRHTLHGGRTSFCGAYFGFGFHEDGVRSALEVCGALGVSW